VHVQLVKEWRRLPIGHVMRDYPDGAGELLIRRGVGIVYNDTTNNRSDSSSNDAPANDRGSKAAPKSGRR
jgi:hypothetical protein